MLHVEETGGPDPLSFEIRVGDGPGASRHRVTMARRDYERLSGGAPPARVIEAAFRFLLDREPKEAIMASFDVTVIPRYFPEFEEKLPGFLAAADDGT